MAWIKIRMDIWTARMRVVWLDIWPEIRMFLMMNLMVIMHMIRAIR